MSRYDFSDVTNAAKQYSGMAKDYVGGYVDEYGPVVKDYAKECAKLAKKQSKEWAGVAKEYALDANAKKNVYLAEKVTRTRRENVKTGIILFLLGVVIGLLVAPKKKDEDWCDCGGCCDCDCDCDCEWEFDEDDCE